VTVCDVYAPTLERARSESPKDVKTYVNYHDMLAQLAGRNGHGGAQDQADRPDRHSAPQHARYPQAKQLVDDGALGRISMVKPI
jgi:hypothetical protein